MRLIFNPLAAEFQLAPDSAGEIRIQDAGGLYVTDNVETALQEIALRLLYTPAGTSSGPEIDPIYAASAAGTITLADIAAWNAKQDALTFPLAANLGGTGIDNGANALTVPATGTAALLATANVFTTTKLNPGGKIVDRVVKGLGNAQN